MKYFIAFILILSYTVVLCQKTIHYDGDFYNGGKIKGHANYGYFLNDDKQEIKQGLFRYAAKEKTKQWRYNNSINGSYTKGLRDEKWIYNLTSKDFEKNNEGYFIDITQYLSAFYTKGKPNGAWNFHLIKTKHRKIKKKNRLRNTTEIGVKNVTIHLHWSHGTLIDTLNILDSTTKQLTAIMDSTGILKSKILHLNNTIKTYHYSNGILTDSVINSIKYNNPEYTEYTKIRNKTKTVKLQKQSILNDQSSDFREYIEKYCFYNPFFLNRYIGGDLSIKKSKRYGNYRIILKGLYYFEPQPILTANDKAIIKNIQIQFEQIKQAQWVTNRELKQHPKSTELLLNQHRLQNALHIYQKILKITDSYKKYLSLQMLISQDNNIITSNNKIASRHEYITAIENIADRQIQLLKVHHQL